MTDGEVSPRALALAAEFRATSAALIALVEGIEPAGWSHVRKAGEWSPGKDAEHVADGAAMHLWRIRHSLGIRQPGEQPVIERARLTSVRPQAEVVALLRARVEDGARLIEGLTDAQLDLPARPPRQPPRTVADMVARPLTGHFETHRLEIQSKLGREVRPTFSPTDRA
jgi:hypothetical protein